MPARGRFFYAKPPPPTALVTHEHHVIREPSLEDLGRLIGMVNGDFYSLGSMYCVSISMVELPTATFSEPVQQSKAADPKAVLSEPV